MAIAVHTREIKHPIMFLRSGRTGYIAGRIVGSDGANRRAACAARHTNKGERAMTDKTGVGVIGAGLMGEGMAANLLTAGYRVGVLAHRNRAPVDRLIARGASEAMDAPSLAAASDVVVLCLPNADIVDRVMEDVLPHLRDGALVIDTTTSLPETSERWAVRLADEGKWFVDAPVTGGPEEAAAGRLKSLVGATPEALDIARPYLEATSERVFHFGGPGRGNAAKLINNYLTLIDAALAVQVMLRCDRLGIDRRQMHEVISGGAARSGMYTRIMEGAVDGDYDGHKFSLVNAAKDIRYAGLLARAAGEDGAIADAVEAFYEKAMEKVPPDTFVSRLLDPDRSG